MNFPYTTTYYIQRQLFCFWCRYITFSLRLNIEGSTVIVLYMEYFTCTIILPIMKSVCLQIMMAVIWVNTEIKITEHDYSLTSEILCLY